MAFDDPGIFVADRFFLAEEGDQQRAAGDKLTLREAKGRFKTFLKDFHRGGFTHEYR